MAYGARMVMGTLCVKSSGDLAVGSHSTLSGKGLYTGVVVNTNGSNDATVTVYDNTSAAGTIIDKYVIVAADYVGGGYLPFPIYIENGIFVVVAGTGAVCRVNYVPL